MKNLAHASPGLARVLLDTERREEEKKARKTRPAPPRAEYDSYHRDQSQIDAYRERAKSQFPDN